MMRLAIALAALLTSTPTLACINVYGTDLHGKPRQTFTEPKDLLGELTTARRDWMTVKEKLGRNLATASLEQKNDYAAALIYSGELESALEILIAIEQATPGLYATATNLGTAYELLGKNEHALSWIRAGIRRNPRSHDGSEWIHVAILEAKLAMAKDPAWLQTHSILGLEQGTGRLPTHPRKPARGNRGEVLDAGETLAAIHRQLLERMQFVKPPDPIVGDLLFDYANLTMLTDTVENAAVLYELALRYQTPRAELAQKRLTRAREVAGAAKKRAR
jgi:tetratricopeptide (TPR) repeat protein